MNYIPPKTRTRMFTFFTSLSLSVCLSASAMAEPLLCAAAADKANYKTDYLDNFITLKDGKDGWLFRDTDLKTSFGPGKKGYQRLGYIKNLLKQHGTDLLIVPIPTRGIIQTAELGDIEFNVRAGRSAYIEHLKQLRKRGFVVPELDSLFKQDHQSALFFARDHHWTSYGAQQVAKLTAETIKQQAMYKDIAKQAFQTTKIGTIEIEGSHQKAAAMICGSRYNNETVPAYSTENISEMDLFGDVSEPEVVLVGTSNSNGKLDFNFSGYLMQYTELDILNLARSGGGYDGALLKYLKSEDFKINPPRLLIWEVPGYYSLNSKTFYKKVVRLLKPQKDNNNGKQSGTGYADNKKNNMEVTSR